MAAADSSGDIYTISPEGRDWISVAVGGGDGACWDVGTVRAELQQLKDAGFPVTVIEKPGGHSDDNTDSDLQRFVLLHIDDGWLAP